MNQEAYETFWYFCNERHAIYLKKEAGQEPPWTDDPILQEWKFCNVFRQLDKQSKHLDRHVLRWKLVPELMLFNIFAFRAFNWQPTYELLATFPDGFISEWDPERANATLYARLGEETHKLTSGAYMIRGREGMPKYESIVQTLTDIWNKKEEVVTRIESSPRIQYAWEYIMGKRFWGWGPFTVYQVVLDLLQTPILHNPVDLNLWCDFGPGAERGLKLIFPEATRKDYLYHAIWLRSKQSEHLKDYMPPLNLQDIEFCLCETSKYLRIKAGGKSKERYVYAKQEKP